MQSDARLLELCNERCEPAFEALVERYHDPLVRYCARMLGSERAQDVVQQTFESAYSAIGTPRAPQMVKPWLYRVAHNLAVNTLKRKGSDHEEFDENFDGVPQPEAVFEQAQRIDSLVGQISKLPERQRAALVLREFEGRSYEEIASQLDASLPNVRKLVQRARTHLRDGIGALIPLPLLRVWANRPSGTTVAKLTELVGGSAAGIAQVGAAALVVGAISLGPVVGGAPAIGSDTAGAGTVAQAGERPEGVSVQAWQEITSSAKRRVTADGNRLGYEGQANNGKDSEGESKSGSASVHRDPAAELVRASVRAGQPITYGEAKQVLRSADPTIDSDTARRYSRQEIAADRAERSEQRIATRREISADRRSRQQLKQEARQKIKALDPGSLEWHQAREQRAQQQQDLQKQSAAKREQRQQTIQQRQTKHRDNQNQRQQAARERQKSKQQARQQAPREQVKTPKPTKAPKPVKQVEQQPQQQTTTAAPEPTQAKAPKAPKAPKPPKRP